MLRPAEPADRVRAPTLKDVARAAGVSESTASRVLNGSRRRVSPAIVERVAAAGERLGYTANAAAQAIVHGRAPICAVIVTDVADPDVAPDVRLIERIAAQRGLRLVVVPVGDDRDGGLRFVRALAPAIVADLTRGTAAR
ncbi:LacI family DNA-binding transcriptional regulator [Microbacterium radiodurans]|uniref:LacI family DNA-binding transcriptional regulator n=1 Tax=Microbacterium radiodurans TaxID=661398 RepID=UPI00168A984D|nr:LacI family DNA-binding transcriptional regulator [Microbacterium radiodurans]